MESNLIRLKRNCQAIQIPSGTPTVLASGTLVRVMQALGGSYTVTTDRGEMARIAGMDVDALGLEVTTTSTAHPHLVGGEAYTVPSPLAGVRREDVEKLVWDQLKTVYDPEIPVNVVDLGLVYRCQLTPLAAGGNTVEVQLTLTAPGCGMGDVLKADAETKIRSVPGVKEASVTLVLEPPWNPSMMSEAAKLELGML